MVGKNLNVLDKAGFGVTVSDCTGAVVYANEWIRNLLGPRLRKGSRLLDFISDPASAALASAELEKRLTGQTGEYVVRVDALARSLDVQVFGTPVLESTGEVTGAIGFFTRATNDQTREALLQIGTSGSSPSEALNAMRIALETAFKFDCLVVAMYDANVEYSQVLYYFMRDERVAVADWNKHWIRLDADQKEWIYASTAEDRAIPDLAEFLDQPKWSRMKESGFVQHLLGKELRSVAGVLIKDGSRIVATVSLMAKQAAAYDADTVHELHMLPVDRCVLSTISALRISEDRARYEIVRKLARCHKINELCNSVVKWLLKQNSLNRVALYGVDNASKKARLAAGKAIGGHKRPQSEPIVALADNPVARVARTGEAEYFVDIEGNAFFDDVLKERGGSAFCWPVAYVRDGGEKLVRWVFCAVDENVDAFSPRVREDLIEMATDIGGLLQRLTELHFMRSTFDATSDAILVVDGNHELRRANQAAADLLKRGDTKAVTGNIAHYFVNAEQAVPILRRANYRAEVDIKGGDGHSLTAMITSRSLPDTVGGKVIAIEDLRPLKHLHDLGLVGRVATEVSTQIQTPLTLASSWVLRTGGLAAAAKEKGEGLDSEQTASVLDLAARTLTQLRRIQGCVDRLALYEPDREIAALKAIPLNLNLELERVFESIPSAVRDRVALRPSKRHVLVNVSPEHLNFVLNTVFSFFVRDLSIADRLIVSSGKLKSQGWITLQVRKPKLKKRPKAQKSDLASLSANLGLAEDGLRKVLGHYGGKFATIKIRGERRVERARLTLPLCA